MEDNNKSGTSVKSNNPAEQQNNHVFLTRARSCEESEGADEESPYFWRPQSLSSSPAAPPLLTPQVSALSRLLSQEQGHSTTTTPSPFNRVLSSNSLYGEDLVNSSRPSSFSEHFDSLNHPQLDMMITMHMKTEGDLIMSPPSVDGEDEDEINFLFPLQEPLAATTTPPSQRQSSSPWRPASLSPPPLLTNPPAFSRPANHAASINLAPTHHQESMSFSSSRAATPTGGPEVTGTLPTKQLRPPRAPLVNLRYTGGGSASVGGIPRSQTIVTPLQATSQIQPVGSSSGKKPQQELHSRVPSNSDASILSALTDNSFETHTLPLQQTSTAVAMHVSSAASWDPSTGFSNGFDPVDVRGMNIDIPVSLQQPILSDDDDDEGIADDAAPHEGYQEAMDGHGDRLDVHTTPQQSNTLVEKAAEADGPRSDQGHSTSKHPHHRKHVGLSTLARYETEAEGHLINAIEEELNTDNTRHVLLPTLPDQRLSSNDKTIHEALRMSEAISQSGRSESALHDATTRLLATWGAVNGLESTESFVLRPTTGDTKISSPEASSFDQLVGDATTVMVIHRLKRSAKGEEKKASDSCELEEGKNGKSIQRLEQDTLDQAEKGHFLAHLFRTARRAPKSFANEPVRLARQIKKEWELFEEFLRPRSSIKSQVRAILCYAILPSLALAMILFYAAGNPPSGKENALGEEVGRRAASASWWVIFIGIRQILMLSFAKASEFVLVKYLAMSSTSFMRLVGPRATLFFAQSRGWPCVLLLFAFYSFGFLYGGTRFSNHWLYWQGAIDVFNESNPAGDITGRHIYARVLICCILVGFAFSMKRIWMGHHLGRRLYSRYSRQLTEVVEKMLLLTEIAALALDDDGLRLNGAKSIEGATINDVSNGWSAEPRNNIRDERTQEQGYTPQGDNREPGEKSLDSARFNALNILDYWEEPESDVDIQTDSVSVNELLQFQQALLLIRTDYPFSASFGLANSRDACVKSASRVFARLIAKQDGKETLDFDTLAQICVGAHGRMNMKKLEQLKQLFLFESQGKLRLNDFVKCIDTVYRDVRVLSARIHSTTSIDRAYEKILTVAFSLIAGLIVLPILQINPFSFILSISSVIVAFAFAIGQASSSYFEGILLILVRRPYDIGDRIAVSPIDQETSIQGSNSWIVEKIDLFTTTVRFGFTREVATIANGSLARSKIINMKRSDAAQVVVYLKFGVDVPYQKIKVFRSAVERFIRDRPKEWLAMHGFRATRVEIDLGYIEYVIVAQSKESWQNPGAVLESRALLASFCLEVQKQLEMKYVAPSLPVSLSVRPEQAEVLQDQIADLSLSPNCPGEAVDEGILSVARMFETKKTK